MLPARLEQALFDRLAPKLIKHLGRTDPRRAEGVVAEVFDQMNREFALVPPVTLHAGDPQLLAGAWGMLRETIVAGPVDRGLREVVCESVSALNRCSFCVDAHSTLLSGLGLKTTADAIRSKRPDLITDPQARAVAHWAFANLSPGAEVLRHPPFCAQDAPEIIGSAVAFHYFDRMVRVFLPDSPVPLPSALKGLRGTTIAIAGSTVGMRVMAIKVEPGINVGGLPEAAPSKEFDWARPKPAVAAAVGRLETAVETAGTSVLSPQVRDLITERVNAWNGQEAGLSRAWAEEAVAGLREADRPAARLALLVALAPYQIDEQIIQDYRAEHASDKALLAATAWASFTATRRIAGWLSPASVAG